MHYQVRIYYKDFTKIAKAHWLHEMPMTFRNTFTDIDSILLPFSLFLYFILSTKPCHRFTFFVEELIIMPFGFEK
ncbi:hypothetical protein AU512_12990 [Lonsdalea iberica]|uniref:Uncharacterized protein n=1 Tax=Lonsdalea iberica TaxID=1082703 RepID=A0ABX3XEX6_9GAMM|nr:hypothetical protein AU512_12990 [Lonsdalea iberica]